MKRKVTQEREVEEIFGDVLDSIIHGGNSVARAWKQIFAQRMYLLARCDAEEMQRIAQELFDTYFGD